MRRQNLFLPALAAGIATYFLMEKDNRVKLKLKAQDVNSKIRGMLSKSQNQNLPVQKAGLPDPHDIEDNKMVDEGSQYGVHYYNKTIQN
ncbi:hypothetical protein JOC77_002884 [Peribacillus deserti]|uniref:YbyB n=2 Tax=Peribacillus deserti TaxID=673318 RepID=A0ABS2QJW0_9BACI|nr:hypothetical protein [Peribacillus deserti]